MGVPDAPDWIEIESGLVTFVRWDDGCLKDGKAPSGAWRVVF